MASTALIVGLVIFGFAAVLIIVGVIILLCFVYKRRTETKQEQGVVYRNGNGVALHERTVTHSQMNNVNMDHVDHNANMQNSKQYTVLNTSMASSVERGSRKSKGKKQTHLQQPPPQIVVSNTLPARKAHSEGGRDSRTRTLSNNTARSGQVNSSQGVYKVHTMQQGNSGKTFLMLEPTANTLSRTEAQKRDVHNWVRSQPASTLNTSSHRALSSQDVLMTGMDKNDSRQQRYYSQGTAGPLTIQGRINTDEYSQPREIALSSDAVDHSGRRVAIEPNNNVEAVLNCIPDPETGGADKTYVRWSPTMKRKDNQDLFIPSPEPEMTSASSYVIASGGTLTLPHRTEGRIVRSPKPSVGHLPDV